MAVPSTTISSSESPPTTTGSLVVQKENKDEILKDDLTKLNEAKELALSYEKNKNTYIREKVFKHSEEWWKDYIRMKTSDDPIDQRIAFVEYNKLQQRLLPTQLSTEDGQGLTVQVMRWADVKTDTNTLEEVKNPAPQEL